MRVTLLNLIALLLMLSGCSKTAYEIPSGVQPVALPEVSKLDEIAKGKITFACTSLIQIQAGEKELPLTKSELASEYAGVGQLLHAYSFLDEAAKCYNNAILLDPKNSLPWNYLLAQIHLDTDNTHSAITHLKRAESIYMSRRANRPNVIHAIHYFLGTAYLSIDQPQKARQAFEKALESRNSAVVHWSLGKLALTTDPEGSLVHLQEALQLNPNARNTHYSLMMAYNKIGNNRQAQLHKTAFEQAAIELSVHDELMQSVEDLRDSPAALRARGDSALFLSGDYPRAIKLYTDALKHAPKDPSLHLNLGLAKFRMGLVQAAASHFNDTLTIAPEHSRAMTGLGLIALSKGDMNTALSHLQRAVEIEPNSREIRQTYVNTLLQNDDQAAAIPHLQHIVDLFPADQPAMTLLIYCQLANQQFKEAQHQLETALQLFPEEQAVAYYGVFAYATSPDDSRNLTLATTLLKKLGSDTQVVAQGYVLAGEAKFPEAIASEKRLKVPFNLERYSESKLPQIVNYEEL